MEKLQGLADRYPAIGEVRGKGLMIGMELVVDPAQQNAGQDLCDAVITGAYHNGLFSSHAARVQCASCRL